MANEIATQGTTPQNQQALAPTVPGGLAARPDRINKGDRRGLENMTKDDISIPRLALAQAQSPQVTEGDPKFIEGLKAGDLFNSMTGQNYGREVFVQIIRKDRMRAIEFNPIDEGGGIKDINVPLDDDRCQWHGDEKPVATVFRDYLARVLPQGELIALSFKSKGLQTAKQLNGLVTMRNAPIFEGAYRISSDTCLVPKPHKVFKVENAGWVADADAQKGAEMWETLKDVDLADRVDRGDDTDFDPEKLEREHAGAAPSDM